MTSGIVWSPEEDDLLTVRRKAGVSYSLIASVLLGRTPKACHGRFEYLRKLGGFQRPEGFWNAENTARTRELWFKGSSAGVIARELGTSKNAVISKIHRSNMPRPAGVSDGNIASAWKLRADRSRSPKATRPRKTGIRMEPAPLRPKADAPIKPDVRPLRCVAIASLSVRLMDLEAKQCRYATGADETGEHLFCGQHKASGAWCLDHEAIVFTPTNDRRKATQRDLERMIRRAA